MESTQDNWPWINGTPRLKIHNPESAGTPPIPPDPDSPLIRLSKLLGSAIAILLLLAGIVAALAVFANACLWLKSILFG